ncbi:MauE/DoxX family redox-associated membrane protein [Paenibacillus sp. SI8]|uniref:MauE/DoxX family redox-associated membrane protein n=1 Tax=unclassified Paenibacillus TaxID=185978 RepID=UPI003465CFFD
MDTIFELGVVKWRIVNNMVFSSVFSFAVCFLFILSGVSKLLALKETVHSFEKVGFLTIRYSRLIGATLPFLEIIIALIIIIFGSNMIVVTIAIILIIIFIAINFKAMIENKHESCYCFGKLFPSKTGYGGFLQSTILLFSLVPSLFWNSFSLHTLTSTTMFVYINVIVFALFWTITLLLFRVIIETIYTK